MSFLNEYGSLEPIVESIEQGKDLEFAFKLLNYRGCVICTEDKISFSVDTHTFIYNDCLVGNLPAYTDFLRRDLAVQQQATADWVERMSNIKHSLSFVPEKIMRFEKTLLRAIAFVAARGRPKKMFSVVYDGLVQTSNGHELIEAAFRRGNELLPKPSKETVNVAYYHSLLKASADNSANVLRELTDVLYEQ